MRKTEILVEGREDLKIVIHQYGKEYFFVSRLIEPSTKFQGKGYLYARTTDVNKFAKWLKEDNWEDDEILELLSRNTKQEICIAWKKELAQEIEKGNKEYFEKIGVNTCTIKFERSSN